MDERVISDLAADLWAYRDELGEGAEFYRALLDRLAIYSPRVTVEEVWQALRRHEDRLKGERPDADRDAVVWLH